MHYRHLNSSSGYPNISALRPFKAVLIVEEALGSDQQALICRWLIASGCLYLMAWGLDCRSWPDAVTHANRDACDSDSIPSESLVMTTWHENEPLRKVFWFAKHTAMHPCFELENTVIIDLSPKEREAELVALYESA